MKIGMNLFLWTTNVTEQLFPLFPRLKSVGYDGVEIPISKANKPIYESIGKALDYEGLERTTMFNLGADVNPISPDKTIRLKAFDELKWAIDTSRDLGSKALVGPYYAAYAAFSGKGPTREEFEWSTEVMKNAAIYAGELPLSIEFLNRFETYLLNTTQQTASLVDSVNCHNFGILYDTHQAHHEESDIRVAILAGGHRINHVHFSESHRGTLGTGMVDWIGTVRALKQINYQNWIMIESFSSDVPPLSEKAHVWRNCFESKDEVFKKGIEFLRILWESVSAK